MPYRIAGIDVHKKMLAVVVADVDVQAPTLVIRGALDDQAPQQATRALYDALGGAKAYVTVSWGSHELVYEQQHTQLLRASAEWLRSGPYEGRPRRDRTATKLRPACFLADVDPR